MRSCLAGNPVASIPLLTASLAVAGFSHPVVTDGVNVTALGREAPNLLIIDVDALETDPIEMLRMTRFVLPACIIAVYSGTMQHAWARACHIAGANCLLAKSSSEEQIVAGLRQTLESGCFTDPSFVAA